MPTPTDTLRSGTSRRGSLRAWVVSVNATLLLVVVCASVWIAWENGDRALDDLAGQIQRRAGAQVDSHLQAYLPVPHVVTRLMADAVELGEISPADPQKLYRYLHRLMVLFPWVSYLNIATEDGRFYGVGRADNATDDRVIEESLPEDRFVLRQYRVTPEGDRGEFLRTLPFSDHRQQVWYREPRQKDMAVWSSIYSWVDNPEILVASAGVPLHGRVEGVAGVDMFLANVSNFLAGLDISPNARAFIIERDGLLVASSLRRLPFRVGPDGARRLHAAEAGDAAIARGVARLQELPGGLAGIDGVRQIEFGLGERWYLTVQPWRDPRGLDWLIVVTLPESDFGKTILRNSQRALVLGAVLLVFAMSFSLLVAARLLRPLGRIEDAALAIAGGDLSARVPEGGFRELDRLAGSFNAMTRNLELARSELETAVERRTQELQLANSELERLSREDSLTGLANRRCFDPRLREEWLRARRSGEELSLVLCDIDHFKAYNDRYGHSAGDDALRRVAEVLGASLRRPGDLAARYGGEEFVLLLPGVGAVEAARFAGEIREHVLELAIPHEASARGCVTLSFGIATHGPEHAYPAPDLLFKAADQALYLAKDRGRDRVEVAQPA